MKSVHRSTDWLNHVQFSPTDPGLIMRSNMHGSSHVYAVELAKPKLP